MTIVLKHVSEMIRNNTEHKPGKQRKKVCLLLTSWGQVIVTHAFLYTNLDKMFVKFTILLQSLVIRHFYN